MLTYILFQYKGMLLSESTRNIELDADLQTVQNPRASSCQQQAMKAYKLLTYLLFKSQRMFCQKQTKKAYQMLTYILSKTQSMLLWEMKMNGQPDADLHPVQNPEHALVRNKHK